MRNYHQQRIENEFERENTELENIKKEIIKKF